MVSSYHHTSLLTVVDDVLQQLVDERALKPSLQLFHPRSELVSLTYPHLLLLQMMIFSVYIVFHAQQPLLLN